MIVGGSQQIAKVEIKAEVLLWLRIGQYMSLPMLPTTATGIFIRRDFQSRTFKHLLG